MTSSFGVIPADSTVSGEIEKQSPGGLASQDRSASFHADTLLPALSFREERTQISLIEDRH